MAAFCSHLRACPTNKIWRSIHYKHHSLHNRRSRSFSSVTNFGQNILEILNSNTHVDDNNNNTDMDINSDIDMDTNTSPETTETFALSEYHAQMNAWMAQNTFDSRKKAWQLFEATKSTKSETHSLDELYAPAIRLSLLLRKSMSMSPRNGHQQLMRFKSEMDATHDNAIATVRCDTLIIDHFTTIKNHKKVLNLFERILRNQASADYFTNPAFCECMLRYFQSSKNVFEGIRFLHDVRLEYGMAPTNQMFASLLKNIAFRIQPQNAGLYLRSAEWLFSTCFGRQRNVDAYPDLPVFEGVLFIFSKLRQPHTCRQILQFMRTHDKVPNPNVVCYNIMLQSLFNCDEETHALFGVVDEDDDGVDGDKGWHLVHEILSMAREDNIALNEFVYMTLFSLCGSLSGSKTPEFDRLQRFHADMIKPLASVPSKALLTWCLSGLEWFDHQVKHSDQLQQETTQVDIIAEMNAFTQFVYQEYERMHREVPTEHKQQIEAKTAGISFAYRNLNDPDFV